MPALAQRIQEDLQTRAANDDCIYGGLRTRTKYTYDANGNLTFDGVDTFGYDEENRLRTANRSGQSVVYAYDPAGRRRAKTVTGGTFPGTTIFLSDGVEEIEERNAGNVMLRRYAYGSGIDDRIAMLDATICADRCFYQTNHQGSTIGFTNQAGGLVQAYGYDAYGRSNAPPEGNPFRYTGRRLDPETGLYYYRARYYSSNIGRFLQTDPIGTKDDLNLYAYTGNDPTNKTDPTGNWCVFGDIGTTCTPPPPLPPPPEVELPEIVVSVPKLTPEERTTAVFLETGIYDPPIQPVYPLEQLLLGGPVSAAAGKSGTLLSLADKTRRKPGSLGKPKGRDAKARENKKAKDAANRVGGLREDQLERLHDAMHDEQAASDEELSFQEITNIAREIKDGLR